MRVYQFAKELGKDSGDFIHELRSVFKFNIKSHLSNITEEQMKEVKNYYDDAKKGEKIVEEANIHHKESMKERFNMEDTIQTTKSPNNN